MVDGDEEENFKIGLKLQRKYAKFSLSIASFTSKLINDSLKSGFCNARQQKRQNISIILQNSRLFTKTTFFSFYHLTLYSDSFANKELSSAFRAAPFPVLCFFFQFSIDLAFVATCTSKEGQVASSAKISPSSFPRPTSN